MAAVPSIGRATLVEAPGRASQAAATEGLYERHAARILGYCMHQLGSREEAEDAVQTTFMNAFRALGRGVVPETESAWLFKIAENVCLSRRRSSWRRGRIESPSDFEVIEEIVPGPSRQRDELIGIENALAAMPEQQRRAILLREWQGLSYREIADELEVSQSAVETLIFRARRSLAQGLEQPETLKQPKRKGFRRALHALDLGTALAALKTLLAGSAAVKATAAAVAVTAAAGTAAGVAPKLEGKRHGLVGPAAAAGLEPAAAEAAAAPVPVVAAAYVPAGAAPKAAAAVESPVSVRRPDKTAERTTAKPSARKPKAAPAAAVPAPGAKAQAAQPDEPVRVRPAGRKPQPKAAGQAKANAKSRATAPAPERAAAVAPVKPAAAEAKPGNNAGGKGSEKRRLASAPEPEAAPADVVPAEAEAVADPAAEASPGEQGNARRKDK